MDRLTKEQRSYNMSRVRSKNTEPEKLIFQILKDTGYTFRRHYPIAGKPDIVFPHLKIAVFIDGEFWHGRDFNRWKDKLSPFWLKKIGENIKRDRKNFRLLKKKGWRILRLWDKTIMKNPERALPRIKRLVTETEGGN